MEELRAGAEDAKAEAEELGRGEPTGTVDDGRASPDGGGEGGEELAPGATVSACKAVQLIDQSNPSILQAWSTARIIDQSNPSNLQAWSTARIIHQ